MSNPLHAYAGINETIKQVVETSYRLNVSAFNALFVSRRAGRRALGFARITVELRGFGRKLNGRMDGLRGEVDELIRLASEQRRRDHFARLTARAVAEMDDARLADAFRRREQAVDADTARAFERVQRRLQCRLEEAIRHCGLGEGLVVLARMEAASGNGEGAGRLAQVAAEVSDIVMDLQRLLQAARAQLDEVPGADA